MIKKTIEKTKDEGGKTHLETTYRFFGFIMYQRIIDYALAIEVSQKGVKA